MSEGKCIRMTTVLHPVERSRMRMSDVLIVTPAAASRHPARPLRDLARIVGALAATLILVTGCGGGQQDDSDSNGSRGDHDSSQVRPELQGVCAVFEKVNAAAQRATSPQDGIERLSDLAEEVTSALDAAPESIAADAATINEAIGDAMKNGSLRPLVAEHVTAAGARIAEECLITAE